MQFLIIKKKCFEVKLILNKKIDKFKLIYQNLVIWISFSNAPICSIDNMKMDI